MSRSIDIDTIFAEDRSNPPKERCLPWCETKGGISVVVEPKPHWAEDLWVFQLDQREYCRYADWLAFGSRARFYGHIDTSVSVRSRRSDGVMECLLDVHHR